MKLTVAEQKKILKALPLHRKNAVKAHCNTCQMRGEGLMDILKSVGKVLGPIAKELGPTVLKEFVLPFIKKKMAGKGKRGSGLTLPGAGLSLPGTGLRLAGKPRKK